MRDREQMKKKIFRLCPLNLPHWRDTLGVLDKPYYPMFGVIGASVLYRKFRLEFWIFRPKISSSPTLALKSPNTIVLSGSSLSKEVIGHHIFLCRRAVGARKRDTEEFRLVTKSHSHHKSIHHVHHISWMTLNSALVLGEDMNHLARATFSITESLMRDITFLFTVTLLYVAGFKSSAQLGTRDVLYWSV